MTERTAINKKVRNFKSGLFIARGNYPALFKPNKTIGHPRTLDIGYFI